MSEFKPVKLRSPDGQLYTATTPADFNNLVYGQGYTVVGSKTIAEVEPTADAAGAKGGSK